MLVVHRCFTGDCDASEAASFRVGPAASPRLQMNTLEVRVLGPGDEADCVRFVALADRAPMDLKDSATWLADDHNVMVGALVDGEPAGMVYGYHLARPDTRADMLLVYSIDIAPSFRRLGAATALIEAMLGLARGSAWVGTNTSNAAAMALYERTGGVRPNDDDAMFVFEPGKSATSSGDAPERLPRPLPST